MLGFCDLVLLEIIKFFLAELLLLPVGILVSMSHLLLLVPAPLVDLGLREACECSHFYNFILGPGCSLLAIKLLLEELELSIAFPLPLAILLGGVDVVPPVIHELLLWLIVLLVHGLHLVMLDRGGKRRLAEGAHELSLCSQQLRKQVPLFLHYVRCAQQLDLPPDFRCRVVVLPWQFRLLAVVQQRFGKRAVRQGLQFIHLI
jgi:hypothetical protein